jgi:hypothetical protein
MRSSELDCSAIEEEEEEKMRASFIPEYITWHQNRKRKIFIITRIFSIK